MDNLGFITLLQIQLAILVVALVAIVVHQYAKQHREGFHPALRISDYFLIGLGALSLLTYVNFEPLSPRPNYWDAFHYYIGSKYFPELGYNRLYACVAKVESESEDSSVKIAAQTRNITDLTATKRVVPARLYFDDSYCKARFSTERWSDFKSDVAFFHSRVASNKAWAAIQLDRGYNGSPIWALAGGAISNIFPLSDATLKNIALIDVLFLFGCVVCLSWAFGLPTASFAVIVSTASDIANWSWLRGSELRLDWLLMAIISVCAMKRKHYVLAGAALGYAATLRIFPAVFALGPFIALLYGIYKRQSDALAAYGRFFLGMTVSIVALVTAATLVYGSTALKEFVDNSRVHAERTAVNFVGLRRVLTFDIDSSIGRNVQHQNVRIDFDAWSTSILEARKKVVPIYIAIILISLFLFIPAAISGEPWIALVIGSTFVPFMWPELSNYYYIVLMVMATIFAANWKAAFPLLGIGIIMNIGLLLGMKDEELYVLFSASICLGAAAIWWQIGSPITFWRQAISHFVARNA